MKKFETKMGIGLPAAIIVAAGLATASCTETANANRMNVIYILADDLGYGDLGCTGQTKFTTPNIDRLRAEGMLFTQHYSGCTVSAPSRSALMTGQHTGHTYIRGNREIGSEGQTPLPAATFTLAKMFSDAGYTTACFGKWGLGYPGSTGDPVNQGFGQFFGYNCQREAHRYYPTHLWHNRDSIVLDGNADYRRGDYAPDMIQQRALNFIDENRSRPFFLFLAIVQPHAELLAPEDSLLWRYRGKFEEKPYTAKPGGDYGPGMTVIDYCSQPEPYATFAAMVGRVDKYVGEVMAELKRLGIDKNTIVMFTSDNGPHREGGANPDFFDSYGPFRGVKRDLYEGGIRLPLIVRAPGMVEAGSASDHICASWDMMPTMAELIGAKLPADIALDGISILPSLTGKGVQKEHDYLYWEFHEMGGKVAVRLGNWKGVMLNVSKPKEAVFELYDLSSDIHEDHNVAAEHPDIVEKIKDIMRRARTESEIFVFDNASIYV